jgi:hypothetical protein
MSIDSKNRCSKADIDNVRDAYEDRVLNKVTLHKQEKKEELMNKG